MTLAGRYLYDIGRLAGKLSREFGALSYEKFVEDSDKVELAVMRLSIMKEGWAWLPGKIQKELVPIDWRNVIGRWNREAGRHVGIDLRKLWETISQKLPEMKRRTEALLKSP